MTDDVFQAIGILLTFLASMAATVVSAISLWFSNRATKKTIHLNTVTVSRDKWAQSLRENAAAYFTQVTRICTGDEEEEMVEIYNQLTHYHFAIVLLQKGEDDTLHNNMSAIRDYAHRIIKYNEVIERIYEEKANLSVEEIESNEEMMQLRSQIFEIREEIIPGYRNAVFNKIKALLKQEWEDLQKEATEMSIMRNR